MPYNYVNQEDAQNAIVDLASGIVNRVLDEIHTIEKQRTDTCRRTIDASHHPLSKPIDTLGFRAQLTKETYQHLEGYFQIHSPSVVKNSLEHYFGSREFLERLSSKIYVGIKTHKQKVKDDQDVLAAYHEMDLLKNKAKSIGGYYSGDEAKEIETSYAKLQEILAAKPDYTQSVLNEISLWLHNEQKNIYSFLNILDLQKNVPIIDADRVRERAQQPDIGTTSHRSAPNHG